MFCNRKPFLITEDERTYIRNLYGLLTEATGEDQITLTADSTFGPGKYSQLSQEGNTELKEQLAKATSWMSQNKGSLIFVQIVAGESQLTNYDTEQEPKVPVDPKVLSRLRAKTLKRELTKYFQDLIKQGVLTEMPIFQEPKIIIGQTKYVKGQTITNAQRVKYNQEQFVKVEMKLMSPEKCLVNLEVEVKYVKEKNAAFPCRGGHTCDEAKFDIKMNGVSIGVANLNNAIDGGSRTSGILKIDDAKAKQIIGVNAKEIVFSLKCLSGQNCHSGTPEVVIKKNGETLYHSCSPAMSRRDENEYPIHTLDACGNVLQKGTGDATNKDVAAQKTEVKSYIVNKPQYEGSFLNQFDNPKRLIMDPKTKQYTVGPNGIYMDTRDGDIRIMDIDPGTVISKFIPFGVKNENPIPNMKQEGLGVNDTTSSGKYHVSKVDRPDLKRGYTVVLTAGPSPRTLSDEKSKNIVRFKLDDEAIADFENYYIPKKLVEKTPDGLYRVIATKMTYGPNVYNQGTILKLDS